MSDRILKEWLEIQATRPGIGYTHKRDLPATAVETARRVAKTASRRGYNVKVTRVIAYSDRDTRLPVFEMQEQPLPPWGS